jgi:hypothetical protein
MRPYRFPFRFSSPPAAAVRLIFAFALALSAAAQDALPAGPPPAKRSEFVILPVVYRTPETGWAGGIAGQFSLRPAQAGPLSRPSSVQFALITTENKQTIFTAKPEIYLLRENIVVAGTLEISRYPGYFYGVGPDTADAAEELYTPRQTLIEIQALHRLGAGGALYGGLVFIHESYHFIYFNPAGRLIRGGIPGSQGGVFTGLGLGLRWDDRDNIFFPRRGRFWQIYAVRTGGWLGADYAFTRIKADLRQYTSLWAGHILALQLRFEAASGGGVPFMALPKLGGDSLMRGYYAGRYRDNVMAAVQAEYRLPVFWRFDAVLFGGLGQVAPSLAALRAGALRTSVGAGLRLRVSAEGTNLRMDIGWGHGSPGVYFTAGEAF